MTEEKGSELLIFGADVKPWILKFDGLSIEKLVGAGVVIISPSGIKTTLSFAIDFKCTNNQAKYKALIIGLKILQDLGAKEVLIIGDS